MIHYSVLPAEDHVDECEHHVDSEQPKTVEVWLHKKDDEEIDIMAVHPNESIEWLNDFSEGGTITFRKKEITGIMHTLGYTPSSDWQITDLFGNECVRLFNLVDSSESDDA